MKTYTLTIDLLSYWHAGSGHGAKGDVDALVLRDTAGFPYLPGRTLKGLLRDALCEMGGEADALRLFGQPATQGRNHGSLPGLLAVDDARLPEVERTWIEQSPDPDGLKAQLFDSVASTAISASGVARSKTLRLIEVTLPVTLTASLTPIMEDALPATDLALLTQACGLIRQLGAHRHRGLGRCRLSLNPSAN